MTRAKAAPITPPLTPLAVPRPRIGPWLKSSAAAMPSLHFIAGTLTPPAPRSVLFSAAQEDQWANPAGQFEVLQAADLVYRFFGVEGLGVEKMPGLGRLVGHRLGYYIRDGKHSMTADDWRVFMDFADKTFQ